MTALITELIAVIANIFFLMALALAVVEIVYEVKAAFIKLRGRNNER